MRHIINSIIVFLLLFMVPAITFVVWLTIVIGAVAGCRQAKKFFGRD